MASEQSIQVARLAQQIYKGKLKEELEASNLNDFVAIEPESGDFFLGETLSAAIQAARTVYPDRLPFVRRVGHPTAVEIGTESAHEN